MFGFKRKATVDRLRFFADEVEEGRGLWSNLVPGEPEQYLLDPITIFSASLQPHAMRMAAFPSVLISDFEQRLFAALIAMGIPRAPLLRWTFLYSEQMPRKPAKLEAFREVLDWAAHNALTEKGKRNEAAIKGVWFVFVTGYLAAKSDFYRSLKIVG